MSSFESDMNNYEMKEVKNKIFVFVESMDSLDDVNFLYKLIQNFHHVKSFFRSLGMFSRWYN